MSKIIQMSLNTSSFIVEVDQDTYDNYMVNNEEINDFLPVGIASIGGSNNPALKNCLIITSHSISLQENDIVNAVSFVSSFNKN